MLPISKILVPVDFSNRCLGMMPYIRAVAQRYGSEVILIHVVNPVYAIPDPGGSAPALFPISRATFQERAERLEKFATAELEGLPVRRLAYEGNPESQIAAMVETEGIGMVAMPTHGYGVLRRWLIGSVTSKVLHDVSCPVLTGVHTETQPVHRGSQFTHVACAIDLDGHGVRTLSWAAQFANDFGAQLSVVHVIPEVGSRFSLNHHSQLKQELEKSALARLEEIKRSAGIETATNSIQEGDVASRVSSFVAAAGADIAVIGRGAAEGKEGRLRTNAYAIIRQSGCPVISV